MTSGYMIRCLSLREKDNLRSCRIGVALSILDDLRLGRRDRVLDDVPNGDAYISLAILSGVRHWCAAPAAVEQHGARGDARSLALAVRRDARERRYGRCRVQPRERAHIRVALFHCRPRHLLVPPMF